MLDKKKVVVGMSGGVDSTVAAYKLKELGYEVIGINMKLWKEEKFEDEQFENDGGCCSLSSVNDARRVCSKLDIPFYVVNFKEIFKKKVVDYFVDDYQNGRTPNPCIACNKFIKFDALLRKAHELGAYYVATGHYAKIEYDNNINRYLVKKSNEDKKDQTYAIYNLTQEQLKHTLMPLGDFNSKDDVRKIANSFDFSMSKKKDSQEICFVPDDDYSGFVERYIDKKFTKGNFIDLKGKILGKHNGIINYTIGQRKGLGITFGKPTYVIDINSKTNEITLGDNEGVFKKNLIANEFNSIYYDKIEGELEVYAKIRYSAKLTKCIISVIEEDKIKVTFMSPVRAITPGQAVVFYKGEYMIGGATIERSF
ncbi:tRNA 2-thiouridine(34) synthase MnmA [Helicovermis profundi]